MSSGRDEQAGEDAQTAEIPFRAIVEQSLVGIYVIQDELVQYANAVFAGLTGHLPEEIVGMHIRDLTPPWRSEENLQRIRQRVSGEIPSMRFRTQGWHKDGYPVDVEVHGSRVIFRGRPAVAGVAISIAENVRFEHELLHSQEQLRALAAHINEDREKQRQHTARELHDVLGGILTSLKMDAARVRRRLERDDNREIVDGIVDLAQEAIDAVRQLSEALHPSLLDHLGLVQAVNRQLDSFAARHGIACSIDATASPLPISHAQGIAAYRIVQEALTNIARHAGATRVQVALRLDGDTLHLAVADNGRGVAPAELERPSIGIVGMHERAREAGGHLEICPGLEGGTVLRLTLLPQAERTPHD
ncbi:PAS domain-containing sensor histidine kinase [Sulfuritalea sp.]|uniref:PAS domain-containing sensor histidine kinase n=1 Tax=Sulfuritalea sp. TaxID=2480090 RepID=UPI00286DC4E5|nr:PAS domain-containing sensor histidine kinase [Sulfuritalea sp.]